MSQGISRRAFARASVLTLGSFAILRHARGDAPLELRCSLDTAPSHPRNVAFRDFLGKLEQASDGQVKTKLFESGSLFPDLQVLKALVQGQVEMACPGTWTLTGFVADADFSQLAGVLRPADRDWCTRRPTARGGKFVNDEIPSKLHVEVLGPWFDLGFNNWYSTPQAAELTGRSEGHEAAQPRRRAELLAHPLSSAAFPTSPPGRTCRWRCRRARSTG